MTTHVFIVDSTTFKVHLENLFAGTGAKDMVVDFNDSANSKLGPTTEQMLVDMIADVSRIREGEQLIFYLQQNFQDGIREGKFYGVFKIKKAGELLAFYDPNDSKQYLMDELDKSLTFRVLIEPYQVYPIGVTEWEALDDIKNIISPHQMLWSLIYRKLKGNRGCTAITTYESQRLCNLIRAKNNRIALEVNNRQLTFNKKSEQIELLNRKSPEYAGRRVDLNIFPRLIEKYKENKQFEHHLEALISKNLGFGTNPSLDKYLLENKELVWLGNQVACGVGMQRIDILFSLKEGEQYFHCPVELKSTFASEDNIRQLRRYMDWMNQYFIPNLPGDLCPILITRKIPSQQIGRKGEFKFVSKGRSEYFKNLIACFDQFNAEYRCRIKFLEYAIDSRDNLTFEETDY
ncbi:MAG: DUF91 domain-containing protein [Candidatus Omnitrophota bacterium]